MLNQTLRMRSVQVKKQNERCTWTAGCFPTARERNGKRAIRIVRLKFFCRTFVGNICVCPILPDVRR